MSDQVIVYYCFASKINKTIKINKIQHLVNLNQVFIVFESQ